LDEQRRLLILQLRGTEAHMGFDDAVANFPAWAMNQRPPNVDYTPWHILEHVRITQWDILRYIEDPVGHVSPNWPTEYWPAKEAETDEAGFRQTVEQFHDDLRALERIGADESVDLFAILEGTPGHTVFREMTVVGNHNSYHLGEFASLRQVMGSWGPGHR
jgi:DinB superfamily